MAKRLDLREKRSKKTSCERGMLSVELVMELACLPAACRLEALTERLNVNGSNINLVNQLKNTVRRHAR